MFARGYYFHHSITGGGTLPMALLFRSKYFYHAINPSHHLAKVHDGGSFLCQKGLTQNPLGSFDAEHHL